MAKVLVVEDDRSLLVELKQWLEVENYVVETAWDGRKALELLKAYHYDLIVLDWDLPYVNGLELLRDLRQRRDTTPVLMLTGKVEIEEKESGLDFGADDYLTKPFQFRELSARLRSLLRRASGLSESVLKVGGIAMDCSAKRVVAGSQEIKLLPKEFALLEFLLRHPDQVFNAESLLSRVWSSDSEASINTVKTYVYMLRKKLAAVGFSEFIQTAHGFGYKLVLPK
jgi:DNA-binding response OmpR family regulator